MSEPKWTHYGWWGICPVKVADIDSEAPILATRHWLFEPLFWLSESMAALTNIAGPLINADFEPGFAFLVTGEYE